MKVKIKKFQENCPDVVGSLVHDTYDHVGRGGQDVYAQMTQSNPEVVEEDAGGPPSAISTSGSMTALSANPSNPLEDEEKKKTEEDFAHFSYINNVQTPGEAQVNPVGSQLQTSAQLEEGEIWGGLGIDGDGGRISSMHSLNQQAFDNFNSDISTNLQSVDTTDHAQGVSKSQKFSNEENAVINVSDGETPLMSVSKDVGGTTAMINSNHQSLIDRPIHPAAKSDALDNVDDEKKLEALIKSKFPNHTKKHMQLFEQQYDKKNGKIKIQSKMFNPSFVLKYGDPSTYFIEYLEHYTKPSDLDGVAQNNDQHIVDKYNVINSNEESIPQTLEEENMADFNFDELEDEKDTEGETGDESAEAAIEDEVEAGEGDELLDILKKIADGGLSAEEAIEDVKAAIEKEDEVSGDVDGDGDHDMDDHAAENDASEEEQVEESGMPMINQESVAKSHEEAMVESKAKAAKKPEPKKAPAKAPAKKAPAKPFPPKKGKLKENFDAPKTKPYPANFYYVYQNGRVVDFGQVSKISESQITLANGKTYSLSNVTLAAMRGW